MMKSLHLQQQQRRQHVFFVLFLLLGWILPSSLTLGKQCKVLNEDGQDVTSDVYITTDEEFDIDGVDGYVLCDGTYACRNYTMSHCAAIKCTGKEACYFATMEGITHLLECQTTHSCHRAQVHFAPIVTTSSGAAVQPQQQQSMTCQGEGACDVTYINGPDLHLECFGRKACRKVDATVDTVHCTHGDDYYEACSGYAGFVANCILCGYRGCNEHVNVCRYKHSANDKYVGCVPESSIGDTCTDYQIASLTTEIETKGDIMIAISNEEQEEEEIAASKGNNNNGAI